MRILIYACLIIIANLFVADAKSAAADPKPCEPCSNEDIYYVESQYFDLQNLTKPIDDFQEKLNIMILVYLDMNTKSLYTK